MKLLGIILLCLCGVMTAGVLVGREEERLSYASSLRQLAEHIRHSVENYALSMSAILASCPRRLLEDCGYRGNGPPESLEELIKNSTVGDVQSADIFGRFAGDFGKGYRLSEVQKCEECIAALRGRETLLRERLPQRRRIALWGCASAALLAVILLL